MPVLPAGEINLLPGSAQAISVPLAMNPTIKRLREGLRILLSSLWVLGLATSFVSVRGQSVPSSPDSISKEVAASGLVAAVERKETEAKASAAYKDLLKEKMGLESERDAAKAQLADVVATLQIVQNQRDELAKQLLNQAAATAKMQGALATAMEGRGKTVAPPPAK